MIELESFPGLFVDFYELTMAQCYFLKAIKKEATFEVFVREKRKNRGFYIAAGISEVIKRIKEFKFKEKDLEYLKKLRIFEEEFLEYLKEFKFIGNIWSVNEAEIIFPQEPILRITAPLIQAQILESLVLNTLNLYITLASKAIRVILSAKDKPVIDFSLRRTQGLSASLASAYTSFICGAQATSNVLAGFLYKIPVTGTMAHSFVMSFDSEFESFLTFAQKYPEKSILLIDTYGTDSGIKNAIKISEVLKKYKKELKGVRIDSGDLVSEAKKVRKILDSEKLNNVKIILSGNLDEYKIKKILDKKTPVDGFGVGTLMGTSADLPYADLIYKLTEIKDEDSKEILPVMKLSKNKVTYPGRKQIFRVYDERGKMEKDILGLEDENIEGKKLLKLRVKKGRLIDDFPKIEEVRRFVEKNIKTLPDYLKELTVKRFYPVLISKGVKLLQKKAQSLIRKRTAKFENIIFWDVDTQNDFMSKKGSLYVKGAEKIIPYLKELTKIAKEKEIKILGSVDAHPKDSKEFEAFPPHCIKGTWGQKKIKGTLLKKVVFIPYDKKLTSKEVQDILKNYPQVIFEKDDIDVFTNPNVDLFLEKYTQVYIYGVVTEFCVRKAVEGFLKRKFKVFIIKEAIKEVDVKKALSLMTLWQKRGAELISLKNLKF